MKTKKLALTAVLFAVALVLSFVENSFVIIPACPGVKLGLSNVAVMFALISIDRKTAAGMVVLKGLFALLTRGVIAGALSLSGGLVSLLGVTLILIIKNTSYTILGITGALLHNLVQYIVICFIYGGVSFIPYLPLLIVSGTFFGIVNGILLHSVTPSLNKLRR
ncbi:MAG: Gx transporter family protein [Clostridia bacterium]|nr:Gx transporter family protein [Clostridia bacterium]